MDPAEARLLRAWNVTPLAPRAAMSLPPFQTAFYLCLILLGPAVGSAAPSLLERSPFLPPDYQVPGTREEVVGPPPTAGHLQFRGVFALNGVVKVNFFNAKTNEGVWVPINGQVDGFRVVSYDAENRTVALDVNGQVSQFDLAKPGDAPMAVAGAPTRATPGQPGVRPNVRPTTAGGTPTVRRRTIVPPRASNVSRSTSRRIPTRSVVRPGGRENASGTSGSTQRNSDGQPRGYVNPRYRNRAGNN